MKAVSFYIVQGVKIIFFFNGAQRQRESLIKKYIHIRARILVMERKNLVWVQNHLPE